MKTMTLGSRLILGGILIVVVPLLIIGVFAVTKSSDALTEVSREQGANVAAKLAEMTQVAVSQELRVVKELALEENTVKTAAKIARGKAEEAAADIEGLNRHLANVKKEIGGDFEHVVVAGPDGVVFADDSNGKVKGLNVADRDYFKAAKDGKASIGAVSRSKMTGNPIMPIGAPLLGEKGEFVGCIAVIAKIDFLMERIVGTKLGQTGYSFMTDATGRVIAHPKKEHILELDMKTLKGMETIAGQMLAHKSGVEPYVFEGISKIAGFAPVPLTGWSVATTQSTDEFLASAHAIRNGILTLISLKSA